MYSILLTLLVSNFSVIDNVVNFEQSLNIYLISLTFSVLKSKIISSNSLQPENIYCILLTFDVLKC